MLSIEFRLKLEVNKKYAEFPIKFRRKSNFGNLEANRMLIIIILEWRISETNFMKERIECSFILKTMPSTKFSEYVNFLPPYNIDILFLCVQRMNTSLV